MKSMDLNPSLKELQKLFGDAGLRDLLLAYQLTLLEFEQFLKTDPREHAPVKKMAHKLKSASQSMGEVEIAEFCHELESESADFSGIIGQVLFQITKSRQQLDDQLQFLQRN